MISPLSGLLERFKSMRPPDDAARSIVVSFLLEECQTEVPVSWVTVRNGIVFVDLAGPAKAELFMRKKKLLERMKAELGAKAPRDVR